MVRACWFLKFAALLGGLESAAAGNLFGPTICDPRSPSPRDVAGIYANARAGSYARLEIRPDGTARLDHDGPTLWATTAGGIITMAGGPYSNDWPWDEFTFEGFSSQSRDPVTRRYKQKWNRERDRLEILDISDPSNPIKLIPEARPFPWTATFVVSALVVGGLMGRYLAKRSSLAQNSVGPAL
jgi:hypothetical protein